MTDTSLVLRRKLIRNFDEIEKQRETRDPLYDTLTARLATGTEARGLGISIDLLPPGKRGCPYHFHHAQEEAFIILEGEGSLRVAGELLPIRAGDTIFIPPGPNYPHQIINTSSATLKYLSIGTRNTPEIVEYPDSGKYLAQATDPAGSASFLTVDRLCEPLDYWDGEP